MFAKNQVEPWMTCDELIHQLTKIAYDDGRQWESKTCLRVIALAVAINRTRWIIGRSRRKPFQLWTTPP